MKKKFIKFLKVFVPIAIGIYLTWYFFNGLNQKEQQQTKDAFFDANYFWVLLSLIVAWLSHMSRAYRWRFLMEPLGYKPSFSSSYHAVMSGYVINFTVPRSGEFARAGLFSNAEDIPYEKAFATIVIERVIELAKTMAQRPGFNLRGIASGISRGLMKPVAPYQTEAVSMHSISKLRWA